MSALLHEELARDPAVMRRLAETSITVCGAGALGANLAEALARAGCGRLKVIDRDRIEEHNLSTQPWHRSDIGQAKAKILANMLFRAVGARVEAHPVELTSKNATALLEGSDLVVDCFDNHQARSDVQNAARAGGLPCVHGGLSGDGYAEVVWDERYTVPSAGGEAVCDYPLARNLVMITVSVLAEVIIGHVGTGARRAFAFTLKDLRLSPLPTSAETRR